MFRRIIQSLLLGFVVAAARGQSPAESESNPSAPAKKVPSRVSNIFGGDLPQLDLPGSYKFIFRPHFGDLVKRDYMHIDAGLRWSMDNNFDVSAAGVVYFPHLLGGSNDDGAGLAQVRFLTKYIFPHWPKDNEEASIGLGVDIPTGNPPIDLTDGHSHVVPTFAIQHNWRSRRHLTTFGGVGLDILRDTSVAGTFRTNQPRDDSISFTFGGVYDVGELKWTLTGTYATTALIGDQTEQFFRVQPGLLWYVPSRFTFRSKTQWIVGLGANTSWGPDGFDVGLRSRIRAEITFRQVLDRMNLGGKKKP